MATALLRFITTTLSARGTSELTIPASAANTPSLHWHLTRGFQLAADPVRQARRAASRPPRERNGVKLG